MTTVEQRNFARKIECEEDGLYYSRYFFKQRTGGKMIIAPHHLAIQRALDRVINGEITRLVINVPPGYTKTELATINMMGRGLALNKRARFMHLSYSHNLALLNSSTARGMIKSRLYQAMWPMELRDDADSKAMWWNEHGGGVYASSAAGQVTGFRAGHMEPGWQGALIIDDPVKPDDAYSDIVRNGVNNRFNETIKSRLAIETTPMIVIMQRIHYHDLSGYLLRGGSGEKWHHLNLPVIIDNSQSYAAQYPENTHAIPIDHGLPDGWLWPFKHNESHRVSLFTPSDDPEQFDDATKDKPFTCHSFVTGAALNMSVVVEGGTAPYTYVWKKDGTVVSGQTTATFNKASAASGDAGVYTCEVTDSSATPVKITSASCTVTIS
jgi:hypothetical protein